MQLRPSIPQTDPPLSPKLTMPTMYDLPSEDPKEPGLPDEFHDLQPHLLTRTLRLVDYAPDRIFTGTDLNLYYDGRHPLWHKRPDWFLVVNVPRLYEGTELRSSYVIWQESVDPFVVVELLSPGTEQEDLGQNVEPLADATETLPPATSAANSKLSSVTEDENGHVEAKEVPPSKWEVYERILRVPYYFVFSRYTNKLRSFQLVGGHYQEQVLDSDVRIWIPELKVGLGVWQGAFEGVTRSWLRWYDEQGAWILTDTEQERQDKERVQAQAEQERQRAEQERQARDLALATVKQVEAQLRQVALNLRQSGMSIAQVAQLTGLSEEQVRQFGGN